ncbi:hypothetical protein XELAEV_18042761mg [Xenopus laevis]|uniref:Proline-rich protein PRCC n=1 Tax=Xenopus laevis TaxID=8355 RepID=A0A974H6U9_XENLA|nr:hypothetical protein XELAEV_18042761mg [Xenopus laevis]
MSLVAYASSDESSSDSEAAPESEVNAEEQEAEPAADYSGSYPPQCEGEQQQNGPGYCGPPPGLGYRPPGYYGHGGYGAGPPTYPSAQGYGGYSNSQGPSVYSHVGYGPQGPTPSHVNFPPPGLNLPPPQHGPHHLPPPTGGSAMNLPLPPPQRAHGPLQGGPGLNLPPPQGNHGLNLPHPQGGNGLKLPPLQSGPGMNHPPLQSGPGINHPPPQSGTVMNLPPTQNGTGMNLPPPQSGSVINLPPPQSGTGMNLPPLQKSTGMNLPPPHSSTGLNLPRHEMGTRMNLPPPQSSPGMSLPPPHGVCPQSATGMNQPSPASPGVMHQPPPPGTSAMNLPPPQGGSGLSFPPPNPGMNPPPAHGLNLPQSGQVLNIPPPQLSPTSASAIDHRIPLPTPAYNVNLPPASIENVAIPKPKKRTEPVKITVPEVHGAGEDEPVRKKAVVQGSREGYGLSAFLPQPKNASGSDSKQQPLPYNFTKKASDLASDLKHPKTTSLTKPKLSSKPEVSNTPSPSAIKAAAKNAALQVTKQITQEEDEEIDEDLQHGNFFSLSDIKETPAMMSDSSQYPGPTVDEIAPPGVEPVELQNDAANAPLDFKTAAGSIDNHQGGAPTTEAFTSQPYRQYPEYPDTSASGYYQDYYSSGYYQESDSSPTTAAEDSIMDDEAFKRLQGKRNQGREEINFVEIKGDDQLSGNQQWMTKSLTEEKTMKSFSKRKGEQPTGQQRRKHQITYLIHQAKERELELKNSWSDNKLSRRQTQAKYGF